MDIKIFKRIYFALFFMLLGACSLPPHSDEYWRTKMNYTYVHDGPIDTWTMFPTPYEPFDGDCEDFAFTLANEIGGEVISVNRYDNTDSLMHHAVAIKDGWVYDSIENNPIPKHIYLKHYAEFKRVLNMNDANRL